MSAFGPLVSTGRSGSMIGINPSKPEDHIPYVTGSLITQGFMERKNQALIEPAKYFADKIALWKHITSGEAIKALNLQLPGAATTAVEAIPSLKDIWLSTYQTLKDCGTLLDVAAQEADNAVLQEYQKRVQYYSTVFPGFVEEGYDFGVLGARNTAGSNPEINAMKAQAIEGRDLDPAILKKLQKYKKLKSKYRAIKPKK